MKTWKITLEYDGTKYSGWQEQQNARTVQGQLRKAAEDFFGLPVDLQGAGRTDAGVHALAQVAHLRVRPEPGGSLPRYGTVQILRALNDRLPSDISVVEVEDAPNSFHARHDALDRTYLYRISTRRTAFEKKYVWWVKDQLDEASMSRAAKMLVGRHNFAAFRAPDPSRPAESTIVVVDSAEIESDGSLILFRITASHFLWRMVRRLAGVLVKIGAGELSPGDLPRLLEGKADPRFDIAAWTAPSSGLFLESVSYPARAPSTDKPHRTRYTRSKQEHP
jgi:tRNA pseudouridine38-40 synthase